MGEDSVRAALAYSDEESDDSLVGEHSPFVKHTRNKRYAVTQLHMLDLHVGKGYQVIKCIHAATVLQCCTAHEICALESSC